MIGENFDDLSACRLLKTELPISITLDIVHCACSVYYIHLM